MPKRKNNDRRTPHRRSRVPAAAIIARNRPRLAPAATARCGDASSARSPTATRSCKRYLRRVAGYCLTGLTTEHALFFLWGTGANGKSVFVKTLAGIMGDYAVTAPMTTFVVTRSEQHPTNLAMLRGARLVVATETEAGQRWAEARIKMMTGGDRIAARFMRGDFFEFTPQFKLVIVGNHRPSLRGVDEAIRRRLHLIPFTVTIRPKGATGNCSTSSAPSGQAYCNGRWKDAWNGKKSASRRPRR